MIIEEAAKQRPGFMLLAAGPEAIVLNLLCGGQGDLSGFNTVETLEIFQVFFIPVDFVL